MCEYFYEDICDEVIKCDDRAPSVPDVILQVISEILTESSQMEELANNSHANNASDKLNESAANTSNIISKSNDSRYILAKKKYIWTYKG